MRGSRFAAILLLLLHSTIFCLADDNKPALPDGVPTQTSDWHGFEKQEFRVEGHPAFVVVPAKPGSWEPVDLADLISR
ncbi:MAG: hypothetical protein ACI8XO_001667 [Verrucomicrobiales bacterium]|jgi:hypothetical protein